MNAEDNWIWAKGMADYSKRVRENIGNGPLMFANFGTRFVKDDYGAFILTHGAYDGVMNEEFAHASLGMDSGSYPPLHVWKMDVEALLLSDSLDKYILAQSLGQETDVQARLFSLATFMLGGGKKAMFNYRYRSYDTVYRFPEYDLDLGAAKQLSIQFNELWNEKDKVYQREFEKGKVIINPLTKPTVITLDKTEEVLTLSGGTTQHGGMMEWKSRTSVNLDINSACIIRRKR
jgi:hypothetical protein